jgi:type IV pilus assembly protein PilA
MLYYAHNNNKDIKMRINNKKIEKGFTLIELMITVAIVGILASVALPSYQNYVVRSQVSEAFSLAGTIQTSMAEYYQNNGNFTGVTSLAVLGITAPTGKYVSGVTVSGSVITLTFGGSAVSSKIASKNITFTGVDPTGNGVIKWQCDGTVISGGTSYLPTSCTTITN